ncbi:MAG: hydroxymethylbilane synthase [Flavobacteriales bacterium]|nr:hydroxymethylbilane synthase [Flavobacteriales bacterium]
MTSDSHDKPTPSRSPHFRIGTRGSDLALWQAHYTRIEIERQGGSAELVIISTQGDRIQNVSFDKLEGKGFFTKEIESALLEDRIDIAVHSHKDLETTSPPGLCIAAVPERGPVEDLLVMHPAARDVRTPCGVKRHAVIGTSSHRRRAQLAMLQNDLVVEPLRGNVPTRIHKLRTGNYDAIVLARAGIERLQIDLTGLHVHVLPVGQFVPAPAQGALAIQMREGDSRIPWIERILHHRETAERIERERSVLRQLEGGCMLPFGAHMMGDELRCFLETTSGARLTGIRKALLMSPEESTAQSLRQLGAVHEASCLLTRLPGSWPIFESLAGASGVRLYHHSFIQTKPTHADCPVPPGRSDWLWLHSPEAAKSVENLIRNFPGQVACVGTGTARSLERLDGFQPDWIGIGEPAKAHEDFAASIASSSGRVFIPHSNRTKGRWKTLGPSERLFGWEAYTTELTRESLPAHDFAVITSPSQYEGYLGSNALDSQVVVLGASSQTAVKDAGRHPVSVAQAPNEWEAWLALERLLNG